MAAIEWTDVVERLPAPELAGLVDTDAATDILEFVHEVVNAGVLGGESSARLRRARMLRAAHLATVTATGGAAIAGPVISESTGRISRTYANLMSAGDFSGSSYGDEFARLVRNSPGARLPRVF
jgi:hypothetical protein